MGNCASAQQSDVRIQQQQQQQPSLTVALKTVAAYPVDGVLRNAQQHLSEQEWQSLQLISRAVIEATAIPYRVPSATTSPNRDAPLQAVEAQISMVMPTSHAMDRDGEGLSGPSRAPRQSAASRNSRISSRNTERNTRSTGAETRITMHMPDTHSMDREDELGELNKPKRLRPGQAHGLHSQPRVSDSAGAQDDGGILRQWSQKIAEEVGRLSGVGAAELNGPKRLRPGQAHGAGGKGTVAKV